MAQATLRRGELIVDGGDLVDIVFSFRGHGTPANPPDRVRDGRPNVAGVSVTRAAEGVYEVTLPQMGGGFPAQICGIVCQLAYISTAEMIANVALRVAYMADSYDPSDGTFSIIVVGDDGSAAVADLDDDAEIHVHARFHRPTVNAQV